MNIVVCSRQLAEKDVGFLRKANVSTFASNYGANEKEVFDICYFHLFFINLS